MEKSVETGFGTEKRSELATGPELGLGLGAVTEKRPALGLGLGAETEKRLALATGPELGVRIGAELWTEKRPEL